MFSLGQKTGTGDFAGAKNAIRALLVLFVLSWLATGVALAAPDYDLGPRADHFLDRTGKLTITDLTSESGSARFTVANGKSANYGPRPNPEAVMWLRVKIPEIAPASDWALVVNELRIRKTSLFVSDGAGWRTIIWDGERHALADSEMTRYPVFFLDGEQISEKTLYIKVETASSMRAVVALMPTSMFAFDYGHQSLMFGIAIGLLSVLVVYLLATGFASRDRNALLLAAFAASYLAYIVAHQSFLEVHLWPGSLWLSRILSLAATLMIFATRLFYIDAFLEVHLHRPMLSRLIRMLGVFFMIFAAVIAIDIGLNGQTFLRKYTAHAGILAQVFSLVVLAAVARTSPRRVLLYIFCWAPMLFSGMLRLAHDAFPAIGVSLPSLNATYVMICVGFLLSGIVTAIEMHHRERDRRLESEISRQRLSDMVLSTSDSFWETDAQHRLTHTAGPVANAAGLTQGKVLTDCLSRLDPRASEAVLAAIHARVPCRQILSLEPVGNAGARKLDFRGRPYAISGTQTWGYRGVITDITDEIERQSREAQQHRLAALGQMAGGIAHEINNLLHPIINLSRRVAAEIPATDRKRHWLDAVVDAGSRAAEIVSSLLASVRPHEASAANVSMLEGIQRAILALEPVKPHGIRLEFESDGSPGPNLPAQEAFQVVVNLVSNAIYASQGSGTVRVSLRADPGRQPGDTVFTVEDEGEGMDEETRKRALEPFFTRKEVGKGTGLGLAIVHGIVQRLGGDLHIDSRPGQGTRVILSLPATAHARHEMVA